MFPELITESTPYEIPDLQYVESGTLLKKSDNTTDPFRIPIALIGEDNQSDPGNQITIAKNPFVADTRVAMGTDAGAASVEDQNFLFDTGAMMSLISPDIAEYFGLNPTSPTHRTLDVVGASGTPLTVHGYDIPLLEVPYDNLDGTAGLLQFTNVPVFVLDVGAGIDGILGMNLFNTAVEMLYDPNPNDPNGASLQVTFSTTARVREEDLASLTDSDAYALFGDLSELYGEAFASMFVRIPYIPSVTPVPEPATVILLAIGASFFLLRRFVGRRR